MCSRCVLDTRDDPDIVFDSAGVCNHCHDYARADHAEVLRGAEGEARVAELVRGVRAEGAGKRYDCVVGVSGGTDSTYVAYLARQWGLRPLVVHFDNGWNSELAVMNIHNIVSRLGFDLHTYVVDWPEFRDIQLAYLRASVVDIEVVTDHGITGALLQTAAQHGIRTILLGCNVVTEAVLPARWIFNKTDHVNLRAIHRRYGTMPLHTYPLLSYWRKKYYHDVLGIRAAPVLNWVPYVKAEAKELLARELGWRDYGGKHYESVWTRFYQGYILPRKFGIDKRKAHLSTLICSGQITRAEAEAELREPIYDPELLATDYVFVLKKLGLSEPEFEAIMRMPPRPHTDFPVERSTYAAFPILRPLRPLAGALRRTLRRGARADA
jgi:N-acetyl sugar amidotransferase